MSSQGRKSGRSYRPKVEALEALRLMDSGLAPVLGPTLVDPRQFGTPTADAAAERAATQAAWDAALGQTELADLLGPASGRPAEPDAEAVRDGLAQLHRYLGRTWARAGIAPQQHEDCTQAVYETLLQQLGRTGFDVLAGDVGRLGVREVLNRDTSEGPDFFRAIDMVKKRSQRERSYLSLDDHYQELTATAGQDGASADWRGALDEAIDRNLSAREASLIRDTLAGKTPAEIAQSWGVAPKTVSNEKTRAIQKLREALVAELADA